jgi:hypothetical protein
MNKAVFDRLLVAGATLKTMNGQDVLTLGDAGQYIVECYYETHSLEKDYLFGRYDSIISAARYMTVATDTDEIKFGAWDKGKEAADCVRQWLADAEAIGEAWKLPHSEERFLVGFQGYESGDYMDVTITYLDGEGDIETTGITVQYDFANDLPDDVDVYDETVDKDEYSYPVLKERMIKKCAIYGVTADKLKFEYDD